MKKTLVINLGNDFNFTAEIMVEKENETWKVKINDFDGLCVYKDLKKIIKKAKEIYGIKDVIYE